MPETLERILSEKEKKILFVGIGNLLRKDDGAGAYISSNILKRDNISALTAEVSIENYIGKINTLGPDILVLIDAVDMGSSPGTHKILNISEIIDTTFNTHNISLKRISEFFKMEIVVLGIQPEKIDFGENMSYLVKNEADKLIKVINNN